MDFHSRGRGFEEQIELLAGLWHERSFDYEGRWHRVTAAGLNPLPVQRPIPIWIGASAEPALRRAARLGDGFFPQGPAARWSATLERMREWRSEAGRDPDAFGIEPRVDVAKGTPDDWRSAVEEWRALGATH